MIVSWDNIKEVNGDVVGVNIYQDNVLIGATNGTNYIINFLDPQKNYTFTVRSKYSEGSESDPSNQVTKYKRELKGDVDGNGAVTANDALMVTKYLKGKITFTPEQIILADMNNDGIIDESDVKNILSFSVSNSSGNSSLEVPKDLKLEILNQTSIKLSWKALDELNGGTKGFNIYQDNVLVSTTNETSQVVNFLDPQKTYTFLVRSKNSEGDESEPSNLIKKTPFKQYTYNYDSSGRLNSILTPSGKKIAYTYDANGNLIKKTITNF
ncbi:fibronectin type III domain-containing protein [Paenibacillus amylolyticus]|uniref:fibronectin type III domain-containing protein n=1 Tax=Paenibacillus amylolyticus TaxID=1451 RepID=UPI0039B0A754